MMHHEVVEVVLGVVWHSLVDVVCEALLLGAFLFLARALFDQLSLFRLLSSNLRIRLQFK